MSKRKFKFIDLADDDYIEEEIVNQKDPYNVNIMENKKVLEKEIIEDETIKKEEEEEIKESEKTEMIIEPKILHVEEIKNIPDSKHEILENKRNVKKNEEIKNKNGKIDLFFKEKEKLDVKTNIYLKKDNYERIEELYKSTGNSRSSIINKLIEIALNKIDEN
ncbi:MAG: hypothetical protein ACRC8C_00885 [Mycoplasmoidaceae bacterium]